jgi:hypothetical protein
MARSLGEMLARKELPRTPTPVSTVPAIDRIQQILASAPGTFATRQTAGWASISLNVTGVGAVPLPLSPRTAEKLRVVAKPAPYGLREKTLLDPRVRDTVRVNEFETGVVKFPERRPPLRAG